MATKETPAPVQDLGQLRSSISAFEDRFPGYNQAADEYLKARSHAEDLGYEAHKLHLRLWYEQGDLVEKRERLLRAELDTRGLAICSNVNNSPNASYLGYHHGEHEGDPLKAYGVFPINEMTMVYSYQTSERWEGDHYSEHIVTRTYSSFRILCPLHAPGPEEKDFSKPSMLGNKYGPDEFTRVISRNGKFIRQIDDKEITYKPTQGRVADPLYEHFGFPQIPNPPAEPNSY